MYVAICKRGVLVLSPIHGNKGTGPIVVSGFLPINLMVCAEPGRALIPFHSKKIS
jgi:hypothetical protein